MESPLNFALAFALAIALLVFGWFLVRNPEKVCRAFPLGEAQSRFGLKFFRVAGWFYICGGALGVLMLVVAAVLNFHRSH